MAAQMVHESCGILHFLQKSKDIVDFSLQITLNREHSMLQKQLDVGMCVLKQWNSLICLL